MAININDLMECFVNPVKSRIIFETIQKGEITAKQLQQTYQDIPQATLYRALKRLLDVGAIVVTSENRIRGVVEKVYTINKEMISPDPSLILENNGLAYFQMFSNFTTALMKEFKEYAEKPHIDILNDGSGFASGPICVSYKELEELAIKINEVVTPYRENQPTPGRKMRTMAVIYTPPQDM